MIKIVTRSNNNYRKHKKDVHEVIKSKYGEARAKKFIDFYSSRYDVFNRSFLDFRFAFWLLDDYHYVKRVGTKWFAVVGTGGTGKTTLMKNVMYYLCPEFDLSKDIHMEIPSFVKGLRGLKIIGSMRAQVLDEPDDELATNSAKGKLFRKIIGKARQQQLFLGINATDLKDIPPYIYRKLDVIIFCPCLGEYMAFKNKPSKGEYVIQQIRKYYTDYGYKVFYHYRQSIGCLSGRTIKKTPYDKEYKNQESLYLAQKKKDYINDLDTFIAKPKDKENNSISERDNIILEMKRKDMKDGEIAEIVGVSRSRVTQVLISLKKRGHGV